MAAGEGGEGSACAVGLPATSSDALTASTAVTVIPPGGRPNILNGFTDTSFESLSDHARKLSIAQVIK
jgi:hypothetical protein